MKNVPYPEFVVEEDAEAIVEGREILEELRRVWGLKPAHRTKGIVLFDRAEIRAAIAVRERAKKSG